MSKIEIIFFWLTVFSYIIAFVVHLFGFLSAKAKLLKYTLWFLCVGFVMHTATAVFRWIAGGHPPVTDTYELNLTGTWFTVLVFLLFTKLKKIDSSIALMITPVVFLILGHGFMSRTEAVPMVAAYQSPWLIVHVIFAWLAFGSYAISTGAAVFLLLNKVCASSKPFKKIPKSKTLDAASYRFIVLGFITHAIMLVSGAIWANNLWGHYWSWDALETWSLISFLFYAFYLHTRAFLGWKMEKAACLAILGLVVMAISFWGVGWFSPSVHPGP